MNLFPNKKGCLGNEADCNSNESCQSVPVWGSKFPEAYYGHQGGSCSENCSTKIVSSDRVSYIGPNLPCSGINTCTSLTTVIQKFDEELCFLKNNINFSFLHKVCGTSLDEYEQGDVVTNKLLNDNIFLIWGIYNEGNINDINSYLYTDSIEVDCEFVN